MTSRGTTLRNVAAALVITLLLTACQVELFSGVSEGEANEIVALLQNRGLDASKAKGKDGSLSIYVDQRQFATAVDMLRSKGLPRAKFSSINEVFQPSGLVASPTQEKARYLWALGQELSKTVSQIDGVLTARVQVVLPDNDLMKRQSTPASASVFIRYDEGSRVPNLVSQIKSLVADSIEGLTYEKVSITLVPVVRFDAPQLSQAFAPEWPLQAAVGVGGIAILLALLWVFRERLRGLLARIRPPKTEPAE